MMRTKVRPDGMTAAQHEKWQGRSITFQSHVNDTWHVGIVPDIAFDNVDGYFLSELRRFIILPKTRG